MVRHKRNPRGAVSILCVSSPTIVSVLLPSSVIVRRKRTLADLSYFLHLLKSAAILSLSLVFVPSSSSFNIVPVSTSVFFLLSFHLYEFSYVTYGLSYVFSDCVDSEITLARRNPLFDIPSAIERRNWGARRSNHRRLRLFSTNTPTPFTLYPPEFQDHSGRLTTNDAVHLSNSFPSTGVVGVDAPLFLIEREHLSLSLSLSLENFPRSKFRCRRSFCMAPCSWKSLDEVRGESGGRALVCGVCLEWLSLVSTLSPKRRLANSNLGSIYTRTTRRRVRRRRRRRRW